MTFLLLHADRDTTVVADDPIVPAGDIARLADAAALLDAAAAMRRDAESAHQAAREAAQAEGYAAGESAGRADGEAAIAEELLRMAQAETARIAAQRDDLAHLALEVVRRIARDLDTDFVAGIAAKAVETIAPDTGATIRVHPDAVAGVTTRIGARPGLTVTGDAALDRADCIIETALGRTHAGLETQLAQLERAWGSS